MAYKTLAFAAFSALILSACAAPEKSSLEMALKEETYTPTGTLIPRKKVERDGKMNVVSGDEVQRVLDNTTTALRQ
ncbi:hypothetical protein [Massilia endophytica]|uniref:hypothetical protein n=1 Tax=Massilia endophytica TaxID=2899220 RepID=UPI001E473970|nr:hypothetical protein [Massilia endophytica]UGQ47829.1 hypothetical protein LSQ66_04990 [Massilia endophytica]